jgi:hypothetical protein
LRATGAGGQPPHAAARRLATQGVLQEIPLYLELAYLLVQPGNEAGIVLLFLSLVTTEDTGGIFCQCFLPGPDLAGVDFKAIG